MNQPIDIEVEMLKTKLENFDHRLKYLEKNWIDWTKSTKETGQRIVIALDEINSRHRSE